MRSTGNNYPLAHGLTLTLALALALPLASASAQVDTSSTLTAPDPGALKAVAEGNVRSVYERLGWRAAWSRDTVKSLDEALAERGRHGLDRLDFDLPGAGATAARADVARTRAALAYADALAKGRTDPGELHEIYTLPRPSRDLVAGLADALTSGDVRGWLAGLAPDDEEYERLSEAYLAYSKRPGDGAGIGGDRPIRSGEADARVPAIATALAKGGYVDNAEGAGPAFTPALAEAVKHLQRDYGIAADGVIGPDTLSVLNLSPADRARSLAVALERRRWLSRTPAATRIDVNVAAAELAYHRDGAIIDRRRVVTGKPGTETPALLSPIYRLVANPTWTVPKSIQNGELANVGRAYLRSHNMKIRGGWIVQQPGPDNALGLVKFDMRNQHAIYLHDTAAPKLFDRAERHLSHGCVRVADALGFADMLAEQEGVADEWREARRSGDMTFVSLPREIPVRLLYHNVFIDADGEVAFRTDPYGWNDPIAKALGFGDVETRRVRAEAVDVGP